MKLSKKGTPKTLRQAILNGMSEDMEFDEKLGNEFASHIEAHVMDFLSQKFGVAFMEESSCEDLWKKIKSSK